MADPVKPQPIPGAAIADLRGGSYVAVEGESHSATLEQPWEVGERPVEFFASAKA